MQAYLVRVAFRGKAHDDPAYALLSEKMGLAKFPLLPEADHGSEDAPRYSMVDYSFVTKDGEVKADDVLKKAKGVADSVCKDNTVVVWVGFSEGEGKFSFDSMSCLSDDI